MTAPRRLVKALCALALVFGLWQVAVAVADETEKALGPTVAKFDHKQHGEKEIAAVGEDDCQKCHPTDKIGTLRKPGASGHQPCLASGCHVSDFLASSEKTKKSDPNRYAKAAAFCRGCHDPKRQDAPKNFEKPAAGNVFRNNPAPNYHVEMEHFEHLSKKTKNGSGVTCRDCHVVDQTTNELKLETPGHKQCASCHGVTAPPMSACSDCHNQPGGAEYFTKRRKPSDVRSCGSPGHVRKAKARRKKPEEVSCFKHETKKHRFNADGSRLECGTCHYMFTAEKFWRGKKKYDSLKNIAAAPVIDNQRDLAHKMCGNSSGCHARDVRLGSSGRRCALCHSERVIENDLFE